MATGTIILRPSSDVSLGHDLSSGYSSGYLMIDDSSADDDSTYIYMTIDSSWGKTAESTFILTGSIPTENFQITAVRLYSRARISGNDESASYNCYFAAGTSQGGSSSNTATSSSNLSSFYSTQSSNSSALVSQINSLMNNGGFPQISVKVETSGTKASGTKAEDGYVRITQIYMELDYETIDVPTSHIYIKESNVWNEYSKVYKKINDVWVEQTDLSNVFDTNVNYVRREV